MRLLLITEAEFGRLEATHTFTVSAEELGLHGHLLRSVVVRAIERSYALAGDATALDAFTEEELLCVAREMGQRVTRRHEREVREILTAGIDAAVKAVEAEPIEEEPTLPEAAAFIDRRGPDRPERAAKPRVFKPP